MTVLLALLVAAAPPEKPVVTGGLTPMYKLAVGLEEARGDFDRLCLARPFDPQSFDVAVRGSPWRYRRASQSDPNLIGYEAAKGYASRKWMGVPQGRLPQCNLDAATARAYSLDAVGKQIEVHLARRLGQAPLRREADGGLFWQWLAEPGKVARLYLLRHPNTDPRQMTLTLQKWPAERAGE